MLAVDASTVVTACLSEAGFEPLPADQLIAPPLLWSEATSVLHEMRWRGVISADLARVARERLMEAPVVRRRPAALQAEAWRIADELGWARTYDAEYVALARLSRCRLLTTDSRLRRGAGRLIEVVGPNEI